MIFRSLVLTTLFTLSFLFGESKNYTLTFWGVACGKVQILQSDSGTISFKAQSAGVLDMLWPFDNSYYTRYDPVSFGVRSYNKEIVQKNIEQKLGAEWESGLASLVYDTGDIISITDTTINIFSLLAKAAGSSVKDVDTKRVPMILEGELFQVRLVWAGADTLNFKGSIIPTDHYRLDFFPVKGGIKVLDQTDFFHEYLVHPEAIKQLWVDSGDKKQIIQAAVTLKGLTIYGRLDK